MILRLPRLISPLSCSTNSRPSCQLQVPNHPFLSLPGPSGSLPRPLSTPGANQSNLPPSVSVSGVDSLDLVRLPPGQGLWSASDGDRGRKNKGQCGWRGEWESSGGNAGDPKGQAPLARPPQGLCKGLQLVKQVGSLKEYGDPLLPAVRRTCILIKMNTLRPCLELLGQTFQGKMRRHESEGGRVPPPPTNFCPRPRAQPSKLASSAKLLSFWASGPPSRGALVPDPSSPQGDFPTMSRPC